jgi:TRAP-type C4-dicarboxylate transport system permease small subunit
MLERITNAAGVFGGIGILLLLLHVVADVASRHVLNRPLHGTLEISQYWYMPIIVFLGLAIAERTDQHISAPIIYDRLKPGLQLELAAIATVLSVLLLTGFAWFGFEEAVTLMQQGAAGIVSQVPIWPTRFLVPLGSLLFALEIIAKFISHARQVRAAHREESTR